MAFIPSSWMLQTMIDNAMAKCDASAAQRRRIHHREQLESACRFNKEVIKTTRTIDQRRYLKAGDKP